MARAAGLRRDRGAMVEAAALCPPDDGHAPDGSTVCFERALGVGLLGKAEGGLAGLDVATATLDAGPSGHCV